MRASPEVIEAHFRSNHARTPTQKEIQAVLENTEPRKVKKTRAKPLPSGSGVDSGDEHERRWRRVIQGGAPGLGRKR